MPVVIPVIAAFASVAGGVAALGAATTILGTVAAYATIAGGILTGVGALTGKKDLMKIGAVLSIGGAIGSLAAGVAGGAAEAGAAGSAASGAGSGGEALDEAASAAVKSAGADGGGDAAGVASGETGAPDMVTGATTGTLPQTPLTTTTGEAAPGTLTNAYSTPPEGNLTKGTLDGMGDYGSSTGPGAAGTSDASSPLSKVAEGGKNFTSQDVDSWWQKAQQIPGAVADFMKNNPALMKVGGDALSAMYGPQAEMVDFQKSIYDRARKNLNTPIALTYKRPGG